MKLPCEFCGEHADVPTEELPIGPDITLHHARCERAAGADKPGDGVFLYRSITLSDLTDDGRAAVMNAIVDDGVLRSVGGAS